MPKIKTEREDLVIHRTEWEETLAKARKMYGTYLSCWLAISCIFGKRRNEICRLKRKDLWVEGDYLYIKFMVGKKRHKTATIDRMPYTKKITLKHYAVPYITEYLNDYDEWAKRRRTQTEYIFPSKRKASSVKVRTKFRTREGKMLTKEYIYEKEGGYLSGADIYHRVKKVNPKMWLHLARHSVASKAAQNGATEYDVSAILDVSARTASKYVHHGTKLTERWSERTG